jgi:hypothetical protein
MRIRVPVLASTRPDSFFYITNAAVVVEGFEVKLSTLIRDFKLNFKLVAPQYPPPAEEDVDFVVVCFFYEHIIVDTLIPLYQLDEPISVADWRAETIQEALAHILVDIPGYGQTFFQHGLTFRDLDLNVDTQVSNKIIKLLLRGGGSC